MDDSSQEDATTRPKRLRPTWVRRVVRMLTIIAFTYVGVCAVVAVFQSWLVYFPERSYFSTPDAIRLTFEDLMLKTTDGESIAAWYVPHPSATVTVLFCHGNAGNMADRLVSLRQLHDLGYTVLMFDYRGYGRSTGKPSEHGTYADAEAARRFLVESKLGPDDQLVYFGRSLGGGVAIELATQHAPDALVVEATFTSLVDVAAVHYPLLPARWILVHRYDSISKIRDIDCPKLFLHGKEDSLIPISLARRLFEAANEPKLFVETPGEHDNSGFTYTTGYAQQLADFVADCEPDASR